MGTDSNSNKAPYASAKPFSEALFKIRQLQLKKVDSSTLSKWGGTPYDVSSVLSAFKFLNLIDQNGNVTENYSSLRSDSKYKEELARIVKSAYSRFFELHDNNFEGKTRKEIADTIILDDAYPGTAKRSAEKAANLFLWLCAESGIISEDQKSKPQHKPQKAKLTHSESKAVTKVVDRAAGAQAEANGVHLSINVSLTVTPAATESEIYEMLKKITSAAKRIENESPSI